MYGPRVFISMIGTLAVFGVATYALTGSLSGTLLRTLICAFLLQVGYFAGVLFLVWREARDRKRKSDEAIRSANGETGSPSLPVSSLKKHSNF